MQASNTVTSKAAGGHIAGKSESDGPEPTTAPLAAK